MSHLYCKWALLNVNVKFERAPRRLDLTQAQPPSHFIPLLTYIALTVNKSQLDGFINTSYTKWELEYPSLPGQCPPRHWEPRGGKSYRKMAA